MLPSGYDGTVRVWSLPNKTHQFLQQTCIFNRGEDSNVEDLDGSQLNNVCWSSTGKLLAGSMDHQLNIWLIGGQCKLFHHNALAYCWCRILSTVVDSHKLFKILEKNWYRSLLKVFKPFIFTHLRFENYAQSHMIRPLKTWCKGTCDWLNHSFFLFWDEKFESLFCCNCSYVTSTPKESKKKII